MAVPVSRDLSSYCCATSSLQLGADRQNNYLQYRSHFRVLFPTNRRGVDTCVPPLCMYFFCPPLRSMCARLQILRMYRSFVSQQLAMRACTCSDACTTCMLFPNLTAKPNLPIHILEENFEWKEVASIAFFAVRTHRIHHQDQIRLHAYKNNGFLSRTELFLLLKSILI